jgi:hypothetical protein
MNANSAGDALSLRGCADGERQHDAMKEVPFRPLSPHKHRSCLARTFATRAHSQTRSEGAVRVLGAGEALSVLKVPQEPARVRQVLDGLRLLHAP